MLIYSISSYVNPYKNFRLTAATGCGRKGPYRKMLRFGSLRVSGDKWLRDAFLLALSRCG